MGQWNLSAEYRFKDNSSVRGLLEWYFDDASGMESSVSLGRSMGA